MPVTASQIGAYCRSNRPQATGRRLRGAGSRPAAPADRRCRHRHRSPRWSRRSPSKARCRPTCAAWPKRSISEARGEPLEGQLAVAGVVINRANSGRLSERLLLGGDPAGAVLVRSPGRDPRRRRRLDAWRRAQGDRADRRGRTVGMRGRATRSISTRTYVRPQLGQPRRPSSRGSTRTSSIAEFASLVAASCASGVRPARPTPARGRWPSPARDIPCRRRPRPCGRRLRARAAGGRCESRGRAASRRPGSPRRSTPRRAD